MYIRQIIIFLFSVIFLPVCFAASDGDLGPTSTGTVGVSLTIASLVQISGLSDISLGSITDTSSDATGHTSACIYTNVAAGTYDITATSANASGSSFRVTDGSSNFITYTANWNDEDATGGNSLSSGVALTNQTGANTSSTNCGGSANARLSVSFSSANLTTAPPAAYTDTVTLLIEPI